MRAPILTRFLPILSLLLTTACQTQQIDPAIRNAGQLRDLFVQGMTANERLISASSPQPETFRAYMEAQNALREQFDAAFQTHIQHLTSLGQVSDALLREIARR